MAQDDTDTHFRFYRTAQEIATKYIGPTSLMRNEWCLPASEKKKTDNEKEN